MHLSFVVVLTPIAAAASPLEKRGSPGCGKYHSFVGQTREFSFDSSGGSRSYRIHLPANYDTNTPKPLLLAYHGAGNNPAAFEGETRFSDESINPDMITVYPAGVNVSLVRDMHVSTQRHLARSPFCCLAVRDVTQQSIR